MNGLRKRVRISHYIFYSKVAYNNRYMKRKLCTYYYIPLYSHLFVNIFLYIYVSKSGTMTSGQRPEFSTTDYDLLFYFFNVALHVIPVSPDVRQDKVQE